MLYALNCGFSIAGPLDSAAIAGQIECAVSNRKQPTQQTLQLTIWVLV